MRVDRSLRKLLRPCLEWCHAFRFEAVVAGVDALIRAGRVTITEMGRHVRSKTTPKHSIKRIDRLVGNPRLQLELPSWYEELARLSIGTCKHPLVLIDWTELGSDLWALSAMVAGPGRGLPIYQEVHKSPLGKRRIHERFLDRLRSVLPDDCDPILVADAEFRTPFFRACRARGLRFVIRLRGMCTVQSDDLGGLVRLKELYSRASSSTQCLGTATPYSRTGRGDPLRIVLGPAQKRRVDRCDSNYERRALEPWLLATTVDNEPAEDIVWIYSKRMQIEETFRDTKNGRLGWALDFARTQSRQRMNVLLLLAALANLAIVLVGLAADEAGLARQFQANTVRHRRVFSLFTLGNLVLRSTICLRAAPLSALRHKLETLRAHHFEVPPGCYVRPPHALYCADCGEHFTDYGWPPINRQLSLPHVLLTPTT